MANKEIDLYEAGCHNHYNPQAALRKATLACVTDQEPPRGSLIQKIYSSFSWGYVQECLQFATFQSKHFCFDTPSLPLSRTTSPIAAQAPQTEGDTPMPPQLIVNGFHLSAHVYYTFKQIRIV